MASTTVGQVKYDASIDLASLRKSLAQADKLVEQSYKKQSQAAKKVTRPTASGSSTGGTAAEAQARVNAIKKEAQETAQTLSTYTPQIQRQFLTVERANNQVANATTRSTAAIQKFGADSVQANRATSALNIAVQNQAIQQAKLDASLSGTNARLSESRIAIMTVQGALIAFGAAIATNLGAGISRLDTLNNFPKVMANFGISAEDGEVAIQALSQELLGLPTSLDAGARAVQRFTAVNNDVKASTALFLGFNNALIAGGASMDIQQTALEQLSQAYSKGRVDMIEWRALLTAMPAQLNQIAQSMGVTSDALGEGLRDGSISIDDFLLRIAKLNTEGVGAFQSFKEQAMNQVGGVQVTLTNLNTAIARSIEGMLSAIGTDNLRTIIGGIADLFTNFGRGVAGAVQVIKTIGPGGVAAAVGISALAAAMIATRNATTLAGRAMLIFRGILTLITKHPIIFAITAIIAGLTAIGGAMGLFNSETEEGADYANELANSLENYEAPIRGATDAASDFAKQMAKIDEQVNKANEDYRYNLAQLVADKNENIASLVSTLSEEERAYNNAYAERLSSFEKAQDEEQLAHSEKTKALQNQIDFLSRYNTAANSKQISELKFALAQENAEYQRSTTLRQEEFAKQTESASSEYENRRLENQKKLDEELALLDKHRGDVLSVRDVMLRDEIENLKHSRDEQLKSLEQQRQDALANAQSTNTALTEKYSKYLEDLKDMSATGGAEAGTTLGDSFGENWLNSLDMLLNDTGNFFQTLGRSAGDFFGDIPGFFNELGRNLKAGLGMGYASGGFTGVGGKNEPAGIVHKGEYVLPKEQVNQATGLPKANATGGQNVTVNLSMNGVMTSSPSEMRAVSVKIAKYINEAISAKGGQLIGV